MVEESQRSSRWWYLLAIFFGPVGGIIGYFILKDRDKKFAEKLLIIGLVMIAVWWLLSILLAGIAYLYISSSFRSRTSVLLSIDPSSSCFGNTINVFVRNDGADAVGQVTVSSSRSGCAIPSIQPGSLNNCSLPVVGSGIHSVTASSGSASAVGSISC